ncbi:uncharacterized protein LOC126901999 [Daktulosphaira vitifoliae]|uniref:uncharacterized protein LOC126901999 n=1 Tax=Daktulosphaira vitifoliae TaxID=58002 RepID=UPI0021A9EC24|nr:uncharacterized protein LOC126901999 [Daktulosphaira vitifoliae]
MQDVKKRYIWSDRETEHFIRLIIDMGMTNMLDSKRKRNSDLYTSLVEPMSAAGFTRDAAQLRTKWKHLKQDYKVELVRIEKNGAASSRMSYFHLLHEVLGCKPSNTMTYLCEVISNSPPHNDSVEVIKSEVMDDMKMETDYFRIAEPQVDIIQTCDVHTQTDSSAEQLMYQKLQSLENQIKDLKEDWRRERTKQNKLMEKQMRDMLENQKTLMDAFFTQTTSLLNSVKHDQDDE